MIDWWKSFAGAVKFTSAIAMGDVADEDTQRQRLSVCASCEDLAKRKIPGTTDRRMMWCGGILPRVGDKATCGCLLMAETTPERAMLTIDGVPLSAAGKTVVGSERCPQEKW